MATRFGATPAHTYATKVKWLVGCLVCLIALLIIAFVIVAQSNQSTAAMQSAPQPDAVLPVSAGVEVAVAQSRVEEGTRLEPFMFTFVQMEDSKVPMGVIRKQDVDRVSGKFASRLISPNVPLVLEDITDHPPINLLNIPPGYRAVTITVDSRSGVEGFAKPNTRVDVLWTFTQEGKQKVATIVRFTKILSVGGVTSADRNANVAANNGSTTVTLLVTEKDAKKIELARTLGSLSLSLVGDQEESSKENDPDAIAIADLTNSGIEGATPQQEEVSADGVMYTTDPKTGRQIRYILSRNKKWTQDRTFGEGGQ